jgi:ABC-type Fe3+-hydroxamate transport system substrate-binding protein
MTDDLGRTVNLPLKIERAVSLAPNLTENTFAVGAGDRLVGVTTYCNYPKGALAIEKVGDTQTPNAEKIIALRPQVVLVSTASQLEAFTESLAEQKIAVFVTNPSSFEEILQNLEKLGDIFGTRPKADALVADLKRRADAVRADSLNLKPVRVFVQI